MNRSKPGRSGLPGALATVLIALLAGVAGLVPGCDSAPKVKTDPDGKSAAESGAGGKGSKPTGAGGRPDARASAALPTYSEIARRHNARVKRLESFRASLELKLTVPDEKGVLESSESEGNLQFVRPTKMALRIDKAGQVIFWLGSDEREFWWLDLSREEKVGLVGTHSGVDRGRVAALGIPVRPLDLFELLGVLPLPETEVRARVVAGRLEPDGRGVIGVRPGIDPKSNTVVLDIPSAGIMRRMWLDPSTLEPLKVELIENGRVAVIADLQRYDPILVRDDAGARSTMPRRVVVNVPATQTQLVMNLYNLENPGVNRIKAGAFDLATLVRSYGVARTVSLDETGGKARLDVQGGRR